MLKNIVAIVHFYNTIIAKKKTSIVLQLKK